MRRPDRALQAAVPAFPDVPLVVLRHDVPFPSSRADFPSAAVESLWAHLEDELAASSPCTDERFAERSGHRIHQDQPYLVVGPIVDVVDWVTAGDCRL